MPLEVQDVQTDDVESNDELQVVEIPRWRSYGCVIIAIIGVGVSLVLGFQLITIVYAIISPPKPPLPDNVTEISHDNISFGVDEWLYETEQDGCEVLDFFIEHDGVCRIPPATCGSEGFAPPAIGTQHIGTCTGESEFSIFHMRWHAVISISNEWTQFQMEREVLWTGSPPDATSTPPVQ